MNPGCRSHSEDSESSVENLTDLTDRLSCESLVRLLCFPGLVCDTSCNGTAIFSPAHLPAGQGSRNQSQADWNVQTRDTTASPDTDQSKRVPLDGVECAPDLPADSVSKVHSVACTSQLSNHCVKQEREDIHVTPSTTICASCHGIRLTADDRIKMETIDRLDHSADLHEVLHSLAMQNVSDTVADNHEHETKTKPVEAVRASDLPEICRVILSSLDREPLMGDESSEAGQWPSKQSASVPEEMDTDSNVKPQCTSEATGTSEKQQSSFSLVSDRTAGKDSPERQSQQPKCAECKKVFRHQSALMVHMRKHTKEKPFKCSVCSKGFSQKGNLQTHVRTHTNEKPYKCTVCHKSFSQTGNLAAHMRVHKKEKPFECELCTRRFSQAGNLKTHMRTHTYEKQYKCSHCGDKFSQLSNLNSHIQRKHK